MMKFNRLNKHVFFFIIAIILFLLLINLSLALPSQAACTQTEKFKIITSYYVDNSHDITGSELVLQKPEFVNFVRSNYCGKRQEGTTSGGVWRRSLILYKDGKEITRQESDYKYGRANLDAQCGDIEYKFDNILADKIVSSMTCQGKYCATSRTGLRYYTSYKPKQIESTEFSIGFLDKQGSPSLTEIYYRSVQPPNFEDRTVSSKGVTVGSTSYSTNNPKVANWGYSVCLDTDRNRKCDYEELCCPTKNQCDRKDNDCDGKKDEADELGDAPLNTKQAGICAGSKKVCLYATKPAWYTGPAYEDSYQNIPGYSTTDSTCDGKDNDCDGKVDEDGIIDQDGDGYTAPNSCSGSKDDCNDESIQTYDNNCNGKIDEACFGNGNSCTKNNEYRCKDGFCNSLMRCGKIYDSSPCKQSSDCYSDFCNSVGNCGKSQDGTWSSCKQNSDCSSGFCNSLGSCGKIYDSSPCKQALDCKSGYCNSFGICGKYNNGIQCKSNADCNSDFCNSFGNCGKKSDGAQCKANTDCNSDFCNSLGNCGKISDALEIAEN
ncbi:hypothetical protein J4206_04620 [Candidatus Woesearchaeota archaeon]|nr:hypothetical protein [Candidatus Woesearchaeota archaeon]